MLDVFVRDENIRAAQSVRYAVNWRRQGGIQLHLHMYGEVGRLRRQCHVGRMTGLPTIRGHTIDGTLC
jgi:predicted SpoU family rRNA methylase